MSDKSKSPYHDDVGQCPIGERHSRCPVRRFDIIEWSDGNFSIIDDRRRPGDNDIHRPESWQMVSEIQKITVAVINSIRVNSPVYQSNEDQQA